MPGQIISDFTICEDIGMSRTPVREALLHLKNDGLLIEQKDGRGYQVRRITVSDVNDLFDAREGIERTALEIAIRKGVPSETIVNLRALNEKVLSFAKLHDYQKVFDYDSEMHMELIRASGNSRLEEYYSMILLQLRRVRLLTYFQKSLPEEAYQEHCRLFDCIEAGKTEEAVEILRKHISDTRQDYEKILSENIRQDSDFIALKYLINRNLL